MKNDLYHHGVKGMHWGVRRYQNPDGTLTEKGKKKYKSVDVTKSEKTGEYIYLLEKKKTRLSKALSKVSPTIKDNVNNSFFLQCICKW